MTDIDSEYLSFSIIILFQIIYQAFEYNRLNMMPSYKVLNRDKINKQKHQTVV
jgi:hypothetical protein